MTELTAHSPGRPQRDRHGNQDPEQLKIHLRRAVARWCVEENWKVTIPLFLLPLFRGRFGGSRERRRFRTSTFQVEEAHILSDPVVVSKVISHTLGESQQSFHDLGMFVRYIRCFAEVLIKVDQERFVKSNAVHRRDVMVDGKGGGPFLFGIALQVEFPFPLSHCLQMNS